MCKHVNETIELPEVYFRRTTKLLDLNIQSGYCESNRYSNNVRPEIVLTGS